MRLRPQPAPALLLLLPALRVLAATVAAHGESLPVARAAVPDYDSINALPLPLAPAAAPPGAQTKSTKDAPVDGLDGKPHEGPWVDDRDRAASTKSNLQPAVVEDLRPGASRTSSTKELTKEEWAALGGDGDGVMDDPARQSPQGLRGTEGGVSAKDKNRKEKEDKTGERVEQVPQPPKEQPPHPHVGQEKVDEASETETSVRKLGAQGLEVRFIRMPCLSLPS